MLFWRITILPAIVLSLSVATALSAENRKQATALPWFRTQVPNITPQRWTQAPPPVPGPTRVTKADYLTFIRRTYEKQRPSAMQAKGDPQARHQIQYARREAFLYQVTGDSKHIELAMDYVRGDYKFRTEGAGVEKGTDFVMMGRAAETYHWLRDNLGSQDREFCKQWFLVLDRDYEVLEYGAMNRSAGRALGVAAINHWWPGAPREVERREYARIVWNDWWPHRDTEENAEGYNSLWWHYTALWMEIIGQEELYLDPAVKKLAYRYLAQVSPLGVLPNYGDGCGWNEDPGRWIEMMERWATVYKDGRFKWAAHRLFEYVVAHEQDMWQWGNINYNTIDAMMAAYLAADDSIEPRMPDLPSQITHRKAARFNTRAERSETHHHLVLQEDVIPDKLILRTGWEPEATFALVELCPPMGHGHLDAGSINAFVSKGSVLLSDTPYLVKDHSYHNCFMAKPSEPQTRRWSEIRDRHANMKITVEDFHAGKRTAAARVRIDRYMGEPLTLTRRYFLMGDTALWVHDSIEAAEEPFVGDIGPAFQTTHVFGKIGDNWANVGQVTVPVAYIWEPKFMMQWSNRPRDLFVYFLPTPGAKLYQENVQVDDSYVSLPDKTFWNNFTTRVSYRLSTHLRPGRLARFATVLIPHAPTADATSMAAGVKRLLDTDDATVIELVGVAGDRIFAGFNDTGKVIRAGSVETDAHWFLAEISATGAAFYWVVKATHLGLDGRKVFSASERETKDRLTMVPVRSTLSTDPQTPLESGLPRFRNQARGSRVRSRGGTFITCALGRPTRVQGCGVSRPPVQSPEVSVLERVRSSGPR